MSAEENLKNDICMAAIELFNKDGAGFTMAELAARLKISKKTIYKVFASKEDLFSMLINFSFDMIRVNEQKVLASSGSNLQKLKEVITYYPEINIDYSKVNELAAMPEYAKLFNQRIENDWNVTMQLFEDCKADGVIKQNIDGEIFRLVLIGIFEKIMQTNGDCAVQKKLVERCVDLLFQGMLTN